MYTTLVTLVPDLNIGVHISFNIPRFIELRLIHSYVIDIVLGETPWLNVDLACEIAGEIGTKHDHHFVETNFPLKFISTHRKSVVDHPTPRRPLNDYVGVYGNFGYGNITISLNSGGIEDQLELSYGKIGRFILQATVVDDEFVAIGVGPAAVINIGPLLFQSSNNQTIDLLQTVFDDLDPPLFKRDLKMSSAPPPPNDNC